MAFTVRDFHDLVEILEKEPAWRAEIRRLVLTEDILSLPQVMRDLAASVEKFSTHTDKRFEQVDRRFDRVEADIQVLKNDVGYLKGSDLEWKVRERPYVYLSRFALRLKALSDAELAVLLEDAVERALLSEEEAEDAKLLDALARGRRRTDGVTIYLAVEVSVVVDLHDLERAARRAALVEKASGVPTLPVVIGERILEEVRKAADQRSVGWVAL